MYHRGKVEIEGNAGNTSFGDFWFKNKTKEEVVKEISQLRKNIKKKHRSLNREIMDTEELWEKQLKPISVPLNKLIDKSEKLKEEPLDTIVKPETTLKRKIEETPKRRGVLPQSFNFSTEEENENDNESNDENEGLQAPKRSAISSGSEETERMFDIEMREGNTAFGENNATPPSTPSTSYNMDGERFIKTPTGIQYAREYINSHFTGKLSKEYFLKLIKGTNDIDYNYGVRIEGNNWMIGDKNIEIDNDDLIVDGERFEGTRGLYELIFMKRPNDYVYDKNDLDKYGLILKKTNAHRRNHSASGQVKSNRGEKYKKIISLLIKHFPRTDPMSTNVDILNEAVTGSGILLTNAKPNIVYWNDPNELVSRLKVLLASKQNGNNAHDNEINAIIEEIKEAYGPDLLDIY